jgi:hypothetical protein
MKKFLEKLLIITLVLLLLIISVLIGCFIMALLPGWGVFLVIVLLFIRDEYKRKKYGKK